MFTKSTTSYPIIKSRFDKVRLFFTNTDFQVFHQNNVSSVKNIFMTSLHVN